MPTLNWPQLRARFSYLREEKIKDSSLQEYTRTHQETVENGGESISVQEEDIGNASADWPNHVEGKEQANGSDNWSSKAQENIEFGDWSSEGKEPVAGFADWQPGGGHATGWDNWPSDKHKTTGFADWPSNDKQVNRFHDWDSQMPKVSH